MRHVCDWDQSDPITYYYYYYYSGLYVTSWVRVYIHMSLTRRFFRKKEKRKWRVSMCVCTMRRGPSQSLTPPVTCWGGGDMGLLVEKHGRHRGTRVLCVWCLPPATKPTLSLFSVDRLLINNHFRFSPVCIYAVFCLAVSHRDLKVGAFSDWKVDE
jgi:hypothetical protein